MFGRDNFNNLIKMATKKAAAEAAAKKTNQPAQPTSNTGLKDAVKGTKDIVNDIGMGKIGNSMAGKKFDDVNAEITRRQWDQFEQDDKPYILNYADEITSGKYTDRAIKQARDGVNQGFEQTAQNQQMRDSGMGLSLSDAQTEDRSSDMARSKTASLIDAENNARLAAKDRDNALLAGSHMPSTGN